jgi:hypothetical protein
MKCNRMLQYNNIAVIVFSVKVEKLMNLIPPKTLSTEVDGAVIKTNLVWGAESFLTS